MSQENYKCMNQVQHVLERSEMYIGDISKRTSEEWVFDLNNQVMRKQNITYSKGLLKIYDEIISNTQDVWNKYGDQVKHVRVQVNREMISVFNDGPSIPIEKMKGESNVYIITAMFGRLLSSSNYENDNRETIGTFGIGAKATNIFSLRFNVQVYDDSTNRLFEQTWSNNMSEVTEPIITSKKFKSSFTMITFQPDVKRFNTSSLEEDIFYMFQKRVIDLAAVCNGLNVQFNQFNFLFTTPRSYLKLYSTSNVIYDVGQNYEYGIIYDVNEGDQISFVNGHLTKSGVHINAFLLLLSKVVKDKFEKKKIVTNVKLNHLLKQKIILFLNCRVQNPKYSSQSKEELISATLPPFSLSDKVVKALNKATFITEIIADVVNKENKEIIKKTNKKSDLRSIPKLDDALLAGTKDSHLCTLILTEGDSAKTIAISGLKQLSRSKFGVFPLKGKLLNTRNAPLKQIAANSEIKSLISILGLELNRPYTNKLSLRYGKILLMTDQDQDGSHIKGLVINFIHSFWPSLLSLDFLSEFITPIVKASKGSEVIEFFNLSDFQKWYDEGDKKNYYIKYYKGLGTSTDKEAEKYFSHYDKHVINFTYQKGDDIEIQKAFDKKFINQRKAWLHAFMNRGDSILTDDAVLYNRGDLSNHITYSDFINKELVHFSNADNIRSIPNIIDGFKPGQRKVMHVVFGMNFSGKKSEIKVEQLAGHVSANSAYHHGEDSLKLTIVNLANDFVGSNNINLLNPIGQYGSRLQGGKDRSSPRYIYTNLLPIARKIFIKEDEHVLNYLSEENQLIEPEYFVPIIPLLLINGARGIGTGWATNIPSFNPIDVIDYFLENKTDLIFQPWYHNFIGQTYAINSFTFIQSGNIHIHPPSFSVFISELPIGMWTEPFKKKLLENESIEVIERSTKDDALLEIHFKNPDLFNSLYQQPNGFYLYFKIVIKIKTNSLIAFNHRHSLYEYNGPKEILEEFKYVRLIFYQRRKDYLLEQLKREIIILSNRFRFVNQIMMNQISIFKKKKQDIISILERERYDVDPNETTLTQMNKFDYLIKMSIESFTKEKLDELAQKKKMKELEAETLRTTSIKEMWNKELIDLKQTYLSTFKNKTERHYKVGGNTFEFLPFSCIQSDLQTIKEVPIFSESDFE